MTAKIIETLIIRRGALLPSRDPSGNDCFQYSTVQPLFLNGNLGS
jgi:hypothetical protein